MAKSKAIPSAKLLAVIWKLVGGGVLLCSFVSQNYKFDQISSQATEIENTVHERQLIDKGGLIHQADYYILSSSNDPDSKLRADAHLTFFAQKLLESQLGVLSVLPDVSVQDKKLYFTQLRLKAHEANDEGGINALTDFIKTAGAQFSDALDSRWKALRDEREFWRKVYLGLYMLGACALLISGIYEIKAARLEKRG